MFRSEIDFEAVFAGVAGARDQAINAADFAKSKMVVADRIERTWRKLLQNFRCVWALNRELRIARAGVFHFRVELVVRDDMLKIVVLVPGIDAEQIMRVREFVDQQIVNERAPGSHQPRIVRLANIQFGGVVAADPLYQLPRAWTAA